jgi:hypothetical protein
MFTSVRELEFFSLKDFSEMIILKKFRENNEEKNTEKTREQCCLSPEFRDKFRDFSLNKIETKSKIQRFSARLRDRPIPRALSQW